MISIHKLTKSCYIIILKKMNNFNVYISILICKGGGFLTLSGKFKLSAGVAGVFLASLSDISIPFFCLPNLFNIMPHYLYSEAPTFLSSISEIPTPLCLSSQGSVYWPTNPVTNFIPPHRYPAQFPVINIYSHEFKLVVGVALVSLLTIFKFAFQFIECAFFCIKNFYKNLNINEKKIWFLGILNLVIDSILDICRFFRHRPSSGKDNNSNKPLSSNRVKKSSSYNNSSKVSKSISGKSCGIGVGQSGGSSSGGAGGDDGDKGNNGKKPSDSHDKLPKDGSKALNILSNLLSVLTRICLALSRGQEVNGVITVNTPDISMDIGEYFQMTKVNTKLSYSLMSFSNEFENVYSWLLKYRGNATFDIKMEQADLTQFSLNEHEMVMNELYEVIRSINYYINRINDGTIVVDYSNFAWLDSVAVPGDRAVPEMAGTSTLPRLAPAPTYAVDSMQVPPVSTYSLYPLPTPSFPVGPSISNQRPVIVDPDPNFVQWTNAQIIDGLWDLYDREVATPNYRWNNPNQITLTHLEFNFYRGTDNQNNRTPLNRSIQNLRLSRPDLFNRHVGLTRVVDLIEKLQMEYFQ